MLPQSPKTFFPFVWHFLKSYRFMVGIYIALAIAAGFHGPFGSLITKHLIDLLPHIQGGDISPLVLPASLVVINFIVFDNFTWRGIAYIRYKYEGVIQNQIKKTTLDHVLGGSTQFFQENLSGRISNQITTLASTIVDILGHKIPTLIRGFSALIMSIFVSYTTNPLFSCILIIWFICFAGFSLWMSRRLVALSDMYAAEESQVSGQIVDSITNHTNIRIFAGKVFELTRMDQYFSTLLNAFKKQHLFMLMLNSIQGGMIAILMGFTVYFLVQFYKQGLVTSGDFVLILGLSMELSYITWYTMEVVDDFNKAYGKCKQYLSALMITLDITDKLDAKILECSRGTIVFDKVKFQYKGIDPLFENKSIEIKAGQKVGLVGSSGGGKSTFINLILRLYDVNGGSIKIDGQDIKDVTQDSLRQNIAMIPQDPSLFHRSLMENIRYGKTDATDDEVIEAAKKAHAHEFISKIPQGYNCLVGERGLKLSGGQRQRIAIARAILKNAPIFILDEATSQLDSITENLIQTSLLDLMQGKTTIVVAHRLSTLIHMDRILVFDKGKIVEEGSHSELIAKGGLYKTMWNAQVGGFLVDSNG